MARQTNTPMDEPVPPTLPPRPSQQGTTTTTTAPATTVTPKLGTLAKSGLGVVKAPSVPASGAINEDGSQYAGSSVRPALGIGGFITFDVKTGKPLEYTPGEAGYMPQGRTAQQIYVEGQGLEQLKGLSLETIPQVQAKLRQGGYLTRYTPGVVTARDAAAMEKLMGDANISNVTWQEMLSIRAASGGGGSSSRTVVRVSNPLDIEAAANQVAQQLIGRSLDDETMRRFVAAFQGAQRASAYGSTQAPDIQTFTADRLAQMFPTETYARQFGGYMEALQQRYGF